MKVWGAGFRSGSRVQGLGFGILIPGLGFAVRVFVVGINSGLEFTAWGLRCEDKFLAASGVRGLGQSLWFRAWGLRCEDNFRFGV